MKGDYNKNYFYKENIKVFVNVIIFYFIIRWSCNFINNVIIIDIFIDKLDIDKKSCMFIK